MTTGRWIVVGFAIACAIFALAKLLGWKYHKTHRRIMTRDDDGENTPRLDIEQGFVMIGKGLLGLGACGVVFGIVWAIMGKW